MKLIRKSFSKKRDENWYAGEETAKMSENTKNKISTVTSASLGAGAGYGMTKLATPKNLENLANKIEWKKIKAIEPGFSDYHIQRDSKVAKNVAKVLKSERLGKALRSRKGKAAIIGTTALGFGLVGSRNK